MQYIRVVRKHRPVLMLLGFAMVMFALADMLTWTALGTGALPAPVAPLLAVVGVWLAGGYGLRFRRRRAQS